MFLVCLSRVDTSTKDATFGVGLQGIGKDDVQRVLAIIRETFEKAARYCSNLKVGFFF